MAKQFDIVIYGATGYTGRLVAEHFLREYGDKPDAPTWAMAGRNPDKLAEVKREIGAPDDTPTIVGQAARTVFNSFAGWSRDHAEVELYA